MSEPKKAATRLNQGKPQLDFLLDFPLAMEALCRVMELGAVKYARGNWKLGGKPDSEYTAAAIRHMMAAAQGELFAGDSGCLHLAHAAWNLLALIELNVKRTHDPELFGEMLERWSNGGDGDTATRAIERLRRLAEEQRRLAEREASEKWCKAREKREAGDSSDEAREAEENAARRWSEARKIAEEFNQWKAGQLADEEVEKADEATVNPIEPGDEDRLRRLTGGRLDGHNA